MIDLRDGEMKRMFKRELATRYPVADGELPPRLEELLESLRSCEERRPVDAIER